MNKHTPGPWYPHYAKADHCLSSSVWGQEPGNQVAVIGGKSLEAMNANARLIAAAPELLAALNAASEWLNDMGCEHEEPDLTCVVCLVNAAINKAEGREG